MEAGERIQEVEAEIGAFVRARRRAAGVSQEELAERCRIVRRTLFSLETGEGGNLTTLLSVLEELGALEETTRGFRQSQEDEQKSTQRKRKETRLTGREQRSPRVPTVENPWVMSDHAVL